MEPCIHDGSSKLARCQVPDSVVNAEYRTALEIRDKRANAPARGKKNTETGARFRREKLRAMAQIACACSVALRPTRNCGSFRLSRIGLADCRLIEMDERAVSVPSDRRSAPPNRNVLPMCRSRIRRPREFARVDIPEPRLRALRKKPQPGTTARVASALRVNPITSRWLKRGGRAFGLCPARRDQPREPA